MPIKLLISDRAPGLAPAPSWAHKFAADRLCPWWLKQPWRWHEIDKFPETLRDGFIPIRIPCTACPSPVLSAFVLSGRPDMNVSIVEMVPSELWDQPRNAAQPVTRLHVWFGICFECCTVHFTTTHWTKHGVPQMALDGKPWREQLAAGLTHEA